MSRSIFLALVLLAPSALCGSAAAQAPAPGAPGGQADMLHMMALGARNQLGVLEYCQSNGHIGPETVSLQEKMLTMLPPGSTEGLAEAEATGKNGIVAFGGNQTSLEDAAKTQNTTVALLCGKLAATLTQAAKSIPQ